MCSVYDFKSYSNALSAWLEDLEQKQEAFLRAEKVQYRTHFIHLEKSVFAFLDTLEKSDYNDEKIRLILQKQATLILKYVHIQLKSFNDNFKISKNRLKLFESQIVLKKVINRHLKEVEKFL